MKAKKDNSKKSSKTRIKKQAEEPFIKDTASISDVPSASDRKSNTDTSSVSGVTVKTRSKSSKDKPGTSDKADTSKDESGTPDITDTSKDESGTSDKKEASKDSDKSDISEWEKNLNLSFCGDRERLMFGRDVVRILGCPTYVCFRVNKARDSIIIFACSSTDAMAYKVPKGIFDDRKLYVSSKAFVNELVEKNHLDPSLNYMVPGEFLPRKNVVIFNLANAFIHNRLTIDSIKTTA